ncbi:hypothetical protein ACFL1H_04000 [Nanoarchaeota archaeon]
MKKIISILASIILIIGMITIIGCGGGEPDPVEPEPVVPVEPEPVAPVEPEPVEPEPVEPVVPEPLPAEVIEEVDGKDYAAVGKGNTVMISNGIGDPLELIVAKGTEVIFQNDDSIGLYIVGDKNDPFTSEKIVSGESFTHTYDEEGTYSYTLNSRFGGKIIVE